MFTGFTVHTHTHTHTHTAASPSTNYHSCDLTRPGQWFAQNGQKETCPGISVPNYPALSSPGGQCCRWEVGRGPVIVWQTHNRALWHRLERLKARVPGQNLLGNGAFELGYLLSLCFVFRSQFHVCSSTSQKCQGNRDWESILSCYPLKKLKGKWVNTSHSIQYKLVTDMQFTHSCIMTVSVLWMKGKVRQRFLTECLLMKECWVCKLKSVVFPFVHFKSQELTDQSNNLGVLIRLWEIRSGPILFRLRCIHAS